MTSTERALRRALLGVLALVALAPAAPAYIGPGAGLALGGAVLVMVGTFLLAIGIVLTWPFKAAVRMVTFRRRGEAKVKRLVVVGFDGFDPKLARRLMDEGRLPHLSALAEEGVFRPLATACPSISPVAWSSFATGVDASRHNIYDFLTRDPCSYHPILSSTDLRSVERTLNLGFAKVPFGHRAIYKLLQKSQPFWKLLGANRVWSTIIRVPITFPPQKFKNGTLLSGMCVPDLKGTQGSFSFYSTKERRTEHTGGQQFQVRRKGNVIESFLLGPPGKDGHPLRAAFRVELDDSTRKARFALDGETAEVGFREYTPWMVASFGGVSGIVRFYVRTWEERDVEIYVTPINIDPAKPAMPISHPFVYSVYLAKMHGPYATLGLAEDTWALNERVIDEKAFLEQAWLIFEERKKQLFDALDKTRKGFVTVVFDTSDRVSHMFWRYLEPGHPANRGRDEKEFAHVIPETYQRLDGLVGELREELGSDPDTVLMVISDHGFTDFRRGVNLNSWLHREGYLVLEDGHEVSGDWFARVDWKRTKAFTLGLTGIFLNRVGRERDGIVRPGPELEALCTELKQKLEALRDPADGKRVIREIFVTPRVHDGPYADMAPELLVGYESGYRHSWDCAVGAVSKEVFTDNVKAWSGDHCVDPRLVPGVFFCNRTIAVEEPALVDLAPTALDLFGVEIPGYMQGRPLFEEPGERGGASRPGRGARPARGAPAEVRG
jgi:predicted AlkP superfamily phosphohydrolase/phosphomutase